MSTCEVKQTVRTYLVAKCDRVDRTQMVVIFLYHLSTSCVVLQDLLVTHASQELVWSARIDADNMWCLSSRKLVQTFPGLSIP